MRTIYKVVVDEGVDGRSPTTVGFFARHKDAIALHEQGFLHGSYNSPPRLTECVLFESAEDYQKWKEDEPRRKALAKLTHADKVALGLVDE